MTAGHESRPQELRERILRATLQVIRERGMARTRTSAIARAAGCAEGSIYRHFSGKPELLHELARTRLSLPAQPMRAGAATVRTNLLDFAQAALAHYAEVAPVLAGIFADADQRELCARADLGPRAAAAALADYLRAEQRLGRVRSGADADLAARLLLSSCLGESFARALFDDRAEGIDTDRYAAALVGDVVLDLEPGGRAGS